MPVVDLESPDVRAPRDTQKNFFVTPGAEDFDIPALTDVQPMPLPPPEKVKPTEEEINRAALRTENTIASAISAGAFTAPRHIQEGFNAWEKIKGTPDEEHWDRFVEVRNDQHFDIVQRSIQQEREDRDLLNGLPWYQSMPARMMAAVLDFPTLLPGGAFVRGAKGGFSLLKSGAQVGAWTGVAAGAQEVGLHATQSLRTPLESAVDISASTLLGGIIGTAGAKLLTHAEWSSAVRNIERQANELVHADPVVFETPPVMSLGAAALGPVSLADTKISGKFGIPPAIAKATQAPFPGLRILHSEVPESRELGLNLFENSTYLEGVSPRAAETRRKKWNAGLREGKEAHEEAYQAWRKRTGNGGFINAVRDVFNPVSSPRAWFDQEVGKAGRREDMHDVPEVAQAAKAWRTQVADPLKDAAIETGQLPKGITPKTAASYFSRIPNRRQINAEEGLFKRHVTEWLGTSVPRWKSEFDLETASKSSKLSGDKLREFQIERRVEYDARFGDEQTIQSMLRNTADEIFKKYTGRAGDSVRPEFIEIEARGPLKELTFLIPDGWKSSSGVTLERWLENSAPEVWSRYSRIMSADVELARLDKRMGGEGRDDLRKQETADIRDLEAVRDLIRGVYGGAQRDDKWARMWRNAKAFQYIQRMGGVVLSSITEAPRLVMVAGLKPFMETSMAALRDLPAVKMAINEGKLAGNITDVALSHRMASIAEMNDFFGSKSFFEKFMENMTNVASHSNGIRLWTDLTKSAGSVYSQNRMVSAVDWARADESQKAFLRFLGIDESMAGRIKEKFDVFGETRRGVKVANTEKCVRTKGTDAEKAFDRETVGAYRDALNKDLDSMVVTKSVADAPLLANTPFGQVLFQFNTFNMASHQKVLLRGMQEGPAKFISGVIALTSVGMMITYLQAVVANRTNKLPSFTDTPGWWIGEGLDRAGLVMLPMVLSNSFEKLTGFNPVKTPMRAFDETSTQSTRMINRNELSLFGPSAGSIGDIYPLAQIPQQVLKGEEIPESSKRAAERQLVPFNSIIPLRLFLRYFVNPPD